MKVDLLIVEMQTMGVIEDLEVMVQDTIIIGILAMHLLAIILQIITVMMVVLTVIITLIIWVLVH